jgi:hypothetical protein
VGSARRFSESSSTSTTAVGGIEWLPLAPPSASSSSHSPPATPSVSPPPRSSSGGFFDPRSEQGVSGKTPYRHEAVGIIAALLRTLKRSEFQKLLADGLAYAPSLHKADLQRCNLSDAFLGERRFAEDRPSRRNEPVDLSEADLFEANLSGASLRGAVARETVFYRATMLGTVLVGADLRGADFREADVEVPASLARSWMVRSSPPRRNVPDDLRDRLDADGTVRTAATQASAS